MFPVLLSVGSFSISSFGAFLVLGFLFGVFLIWRLSRAWDLDEEKILDLTLLTFVGGVLGARLYFVLQHLDQFLNNSFSIFNVYKTPGFSFWGAILGGWLTLFFITRRKKMDFTQIGDIASVGFLGSLIFASLGCFLGGCNSGIPSSLFFAVNMIGLVGKRFPVQLLESVAFMIVLSKIWSVAVHFHTRGKILSLTLIYIGGIKFLTQFLKQTSDEGEGAILSLALFALGATMLYKVTQRNPINDLKNTLIFASNLATDSITRKNACLSVKKYWYNKKTALLWKLRNLKKGLRKINVRFY